MVLVSGLLSAFLVNNTVCLMLTPLVAETTLAMRRRPLPYLPALAMASTSAARPPSHRRSQNIMIGTISGIGYGHFVAALAPVLSGEVETSAEYHTREGLLSRVNVVDAGRVGDAGDLPKPIQWPTASFLAERRSEIRGRLRD